MTELTTWTMTAAMVLLLMLSAIYDYNGQAVPDNLTVPFALMGATMSAMNGRWITCAITIAATAFVLQPWRPNLLKRLNRWLLSSAFDEDEEEQALEQMDAVANEFERKNGRDMDTIRMFTYGIYISAILLMMTLSNKSRIAVVVFGINTLITVAADIQGKKADQPLGMEAFGGADVIVIAGILGFYGFIPFVFSMTATFAVQFVLLMIKQIIKKKKDTGTPLLPVIFLMAPVRYYIAVTYCPRIVQAFNWAMREVVFNFHS